MQSKAFLYNPAFINDLDFWPMTFKINSVHPLVMVNMSAKFDEDANTA